MTLLCDDLFQRFSWAEYTIGQRIRSCLFLLNTDRIVPFFTTFKICFSEKKDATSHRSSSEAKDPDLDFKGSAGLTDVFSSPEENK
jgi:hypothetical protein